MKIHSTLSGGITLLVILTVIPGLVSAELPKKESSYSEKGHYGKMGSSAHGKKEVKGHGDGLGFHTKSWRHTLTDEQKKKADVMHLGLKKGSAPLKALKSLKETELTALIIQEKFDMNAIVQKIDEILEVKRKLMMMHNEHKVQMRAMLTPDQRTSFDMDLLGKGSHAH
jgi:Spy/CpxP family protein refolding chaperone